MVSLRRRRLLGLCSGKSSIPVELSGSIESNGAVNLNRNMNPFSIHPISLISLNHERPTNIHETSFGPSTISATCSPKEETDNYFPGRDIKHRKRYRRKLYEDQQPCVMRGVYFKNNKWQAAIKVDKKQIHLGTVGSQEHAARLYDRAAFMCGRQPNFELPEEEKHELSHYNWEEFLAITRNAINNKKLQRTGGGRRKSLGLEMRGSDVEEPESVTCGSSSLSDDGKVEALDRGAALLKADKIVTGHNADDIAETVLLNILRGDIARLSRCTFITTGEDGPIPRCKPFKYTYEKEIVMYAYFKKLDYFSTECIYSPNAYRGFAREFIKDLERIRPQAILDIIRSGEDFRISTTTRMPEQGTCERCGYISSQRLCKACVLLEGLNRGLPKLGISRAREAINGGGKLDKERRHPKVEGERPILQSKPCGNLEF